MEELTQQMIEMIRNVASKMMCAQRRAFGVWVSLHYMSGDTRFTETVFGWSYRMVAKGLREL